MVAGHRRDIGCTATYSRCHRRDPARHDRGVGRADHSALCAQGCSARLHPRTGRLAPPAHHDVVGLHRHSSTELARHGHPRPESAHHGRRRAGCGGCRDTRERATATGRGRAPAAGHFHRVCSDAVRRCRMASVRVRCRGLPRAPARGRTRPGRPMGTTRAGDSRLGGPRTSGDEPVDPGRTPRGLCSDQHRRGAAGDNPRAALRLVRHPPHERRRWFLAQQKGGSISISPIVSIRQDLNEPRPTSLFTYTTTGTPTYLRLLTLDKFDGTLWQVSSVTSPDDTRISKEGIPPPAGVTMHRTGTATTNVVITGLRQAYLPVPSTVTAVTAHGDWRYNPVNPAIYGVDTATPHLNYTATSAVYDPSAVLLNSLPAVDADASFAPYLADTRGPRPNRCVRSRTRSSRTHDAVTPYQKAIALADLVPGRHLRHHRSRPARRRRVTHVPQRPSRLSASSSPPRWR